MRNNNPTLEVFSRLVGPAVRAGSRGAYDQVKINPAKYLRHVRRIHRLDVDMLAVPAQKIIASSAKTAALEGMGLGMGGLTTLLPDMSILSAITIRMLQQLSLVYGVEYSTEEEAAGFWIAAASAAGLDLARNFLEKQAI